MPRLRFLLLAILFVCPGCSPPEGWVTRAVWVSRHEAAPLRAAIAELRAEGSHRTWILVHERTRVLALHTAVRAPEDGWVDDARRHLQVTYGRLRLACPDLPP